MVVMVKLWTVLRESWVHPPVLGRVNPEDRDEPRAVEFILFTLEPGEEGVWLF